MSILERLQQYIDRLDETKFYQYITALLLIIGLSISLIMVQYYRTITSLKRHINGLNETREEVRALLDKAQHVKQEQKEVDEIISQDPNFKIAGYFEDLLDQLNLAAKKASKVEVTAPAQEGQYQESLLKARFADMTMKELTQLLKHIESNRRVFAKELEITASKKTAHTIEVSLTIATLEKPTQEP